MEAESVHRKLDFASTRLADLQSLVAQIRLAAEADLRQQLTQEFLFHAVGACDYVAQLVNERRSLGIAADKVNVSNVADCVESRDSSDPLAAALRALYVNPKCPFPTDPYSDDGLMYRLFNYRHEVVHRNMNPFNFVLSKGGGVGYFFLDPRDRSLGRSASPVDVDLRNILAVVDQRCRAALALA